MSRTVAIIDAAQIERASRGRRLIPVALLAECLAVGALAITIRSGALPELATLATPLSIISLLSGFTALVLKMVFSRRP
jgi:hypothetical protein